MVFRYEIFEHTTDAVFGIDKNQQVQFWNKGCETMLGVSRQQALGRPCAEVVCGEDFQGNKVCGVDCPIAKFFDHKVPNCDFDLVLKSTEGKPFIVNVGSYYTNDSSLKTKDNVVVFHSMRRLSCHKFIQRLSSSSCFVEHDNKKVHKLSKREYEVLRLLSKGIATKNIADQLGISSATVRNHLKNIYTKLEVHNRAEAVSYAMHHGVI